MSVKKFNFRWLQRAALAIIITYEIDIMKLAPFVSVTERLKRGLQSVILRKKHLQL